MDQGIRGVNPEPRRGYRSRVERDRELQAFSDAVWQRHEATHARGGPIPTWPDRSTFKTNWPAEALDLIVADWKHAGALAALGRREAVIRTSRRMSGAVDEVVAQIDLDLLDPPDPPARDWRLLYERELRLHEVLAFELAKLEGDGPGDNIERVLEVAELRVEERWVVREWLHGKTVALMAEDTGERPQTIEIRLQNGLFRLRSLVNAPSRKRENVRGQRGRHNRAESGGTGDPDVRRTPASGNGADEAPPARRGSRAGNLRGLPAPATGGAHRPPAQALDATGALQPQRQVLPAVG